MPRTEKPSIPNSQQKTQPEGKEPIKMNSSEGPKQNKPAPQREISHFEADIHGLNNISKALDDLIKSKYVKIAIVTAIDDNIRPVYKT